MNSTDSVQKVLIKLILGLLRENSSQRTQPVVVVPAWHIADGRQGFGRNALPSPGSKETVTVSRLCCLECGRPLHKARPSHICDFSIGILVATCQTPGVCGVSHRYSSGHLPDTWCYGVSHRYSSGYLPDAWRCGVRVTGIPLTTCQTPGVVGSVTGIPVTTCQTPGVVGSVTGIPVTTCQTPGVVGSVTGIPAATLADAWRCGVSHRYSSGHLPDTWCYGVRVTGIQVVTLRDTRRCGVRVTGIPVATLPDTRRCGVSHRYSSGHPARHPALWGQSHRYSSGHPARHPALWDQSQVFQWPPCQTPGVVGSVTGVLVVTLADAWRCGVSHRYSSGHPERHPALWGSVTGIPVATLPDFCVIGISHRYSSGYLTRLLRYRDQSQVFQWLPCQTPGVVGSES